jgi:hypothetical protein
LRANCDREGSPIAIYEDGDGPCIAIDDNLIPKRTTVVYPQPADIHLEVRKHINVIQFGHVWLWSGCGQDAVAQGSPRMTVAVWVKVYDGIALATDSATTVQLPGSHQVYNNADKIFHLHRELPIGAMTWGLGQIGPASISTVSKSLRLRLMGRDPLSPHWELDENYTVERVAQRVAEMFCEGGPVEVAGISLHEGFKWIARKHYFSTDLNKGEIL